MPHGYVLHPCCRVRRESFGLLFYDLRGPKLLFAETGDLLDPEALERGGTVEDVVPGGTAADRARVGNLMVSLERKGFVREQPLR